MLTNGSHFGHLLSCLRRLTLIFSEKIRLKEKYGHVEWRAITGMRDRLIHGYFGVDYDIVWDVVVNEIPALHGEVEGIIQSEGGSP